MTSDAGATAVPPGPFADLTLMTVRDRSFDPVDLVEQVLAAIERTQPALNAFVTLDAAGARQAARRVHDERRQGIDRGPLHGVPIAVKDIVDTADLVTTMGSRHFAGHVPARDAEVVARFRAAGAIIVGKTTTHEFAYGPTGDRAANGPCANPRDPSRMAGGSSAGSAAAVAAGLVPLAIGTDTGGSVRIPAALCGVTGIRPSTGRVPAGGVFPLSWSLDTVGVLAGGVADTATGWAVATGGGFSAPPRDASSLRIGVVGGAHFERLDDTVRAGVDDLTRRLVAEGAQIVPVTVPDVQELMAVYRVVQSVEAVTVHYERMSTAPDLFDPEVLERLRMAAEVPAWDYARALRRLAEVRRSVLDRLSGLDLLLLATVPIVAPPLGIRQADIGAGWTSPRDALLAYTVPFSVLGLPSMSLPMVSSGLPAGAQLVGRPGEDEALLAAAATLEAVVRAD